ncbi:MAG: hypothetical protein JWM07_855 [Candidatus Saccharibacteria bacterium]|nr:hypothetical protein [Candidatus Saccharibacteria bacterium]
MLPDEPYQGDEMNTSQKIATAAVIGAVTSSAVSLKRNTFGRLTEYFQRRKQLAELKVWYLEELESAEIYASGEAAAFTEMHQDWALDILSDEERFNPANPFYLKPFADRVQNYIWMRREAAATKAYSERLASIAPKLASEQKQLADEMEDDAYSESRRLRLRYPMSQLDDWIKPYPCLYE